MDDVVVVVAVVVADEEQEGRQACVRASAWWRLWRDLRLTSQIGRRRRQWI